MRKKSGGNFLSEWFGHRIYPQVSRSPAAIRDRTEGLCPFLSAALETTKECVKAPAAKGVCTISTSSNGPRQDWVACPYRALDQGLLRTAIGMLFNVDGATARFASAAALSKKGVRAELKAAVATRLPTYVYFQDKLGGEISLPPTPKSPELSFDITIAELTPTGENADDIAIRRYGILEVQTTDFHGSYRRVIDNLVAAQRLHKAKFPEEVEANQRWLSEKIEGPNIANVFKRTFYQTGTSASAGNRSSAEQARRAGEAETIGELMHVAGT